LFAFAGITIVISILIYVTVEVASQGYVPSCTIAEVGYLWSNYDDHTKYWQCIEVNQSPMGGHCQNIDYWFSFYHQGCVHQDVWIGSPPMPSSTVPLTTTVSIPTASTPIPTAPTPSSTTQKKDIN
jgi:hypothetical protein